MNQEPVKTLWAGKHLTMVARGHWEYTIRNTQRPAVAIVAITDDDEVVLVEQFRPPVQRNVVELPAGLSGDLDEHPDEALVSAAHGELLEETGYTAAAWTELGWSYSSPGLTDESLFFFLAEQLTQTAAGGGDEHEAITIHRVPRQHVASWLREREMTTDLKIFAGLMMAQDAMARRPSV